VQTFTVGYENAGGINEFPYAGLVAAHADTEHHELVLPAKDFADWIPKLVWHLDEPVGDAACVPLYFLAQYTKARATVLHSGEGADEIFGGYSIYKKMQAINNLQVGPLSHFAQIISGGLTPLAGSGKLSRYLRLLGLPLEERYRGVSGYTMEGIKQDLVRPKLLAELERSSYLTETFAGYYGQVRTAKDLNKMLFVDTKTWLPDDLLIKADKMTMAASVELRVPFLDHRLVEFAARLQVSYKIKDGETKYLLKRMMKRFLPSDVVYRQKKGFPVPVAAWFRSNLFDLASEILLSSQSGASMYFKPDAIRRMLAQHKAGRIDLSNELWSLLVLEYWFRTFKAI
jgi:asparagine synthase (glutamine-hydrolysing)